MPYWGGDLPSLEKKVDQEFNRRRSAKGYKKNRSEQQERKRVFYEENKGQQQEQKRADYEKNKGKKREQIRLDYEKNKEKKQEQKRLDYEKNKGKKQEQKRLDYEKNKEKERERKRKSREKQSPFENFEKEGRYGPIFSCISCHQTNWFSNVAVTSLENHDESSVDTQYVVSNQGLFRKQNRLFICLG